MSREVFAAPPDHSTFICQVCQAKCEEARSNSMICPQPARSTGALF